MTAAKTTVAEDLYAVAEDLKARLGHASDATARITEPGHLYAAVAAAKDVLRELCGALESMARAADNLADDTTLYSTDDTHPATHLYAVADALRAVQNSTARDRLNDAHNRLGPIGRNV